MKIVHPIARTVTLDLMPGGINVQFDAPDRLHLGKVNWHTDFRFEVSGREYWGTAFASLAGMYDTDIYSRGDTGPGRRMAWNAKPHWRKVIMAEARELVCEARAIWAQAAEGEGMTPAQCDAAVAQHYREQREALRAGADLEMRRLVSEVTARNAQFAAFAASRREVQATMPDQLRSALAQSTTAMADALPYLPGRQASAVQLQIAANRALIAQIGS
jgi:hypothetical protein